MNYQLPLLPVSEGDAGDRFFILRSHLGKAIPGRRYRAYTATSFIEGKTDEFGKTSILDGMVGEIARLELIDEKFDQHFILRDPRGEPIVNLKYQVKLENGDIYEGLTNEEGKSILVKSYKPENMQMLFIPTDYPECEGVN